MQNKKDIFVKPLYAHLFILLLAAILVGVINIISASICTKTLITIAFFVIVLVFSVDIPKYSAKKK